MEFLKKGLKKPEIAGKIAIYAPKSLKIAQKWHKNAP